MNAVLDSVVPVAEAVIAFFISLGLRLQDTSLEIIAGPGGVLVLTLGILGVCVLAYDLLWLAWRSATRLRGRRTPAPSREDRVRNLLQIGAAPAEIARAVGLSRDALALVEPASVPSRPKMPDAAQTAVRAPSPAAAPSPSFGAQLAAQQAVADVEPASPSEARHVPNSRRRNANAPNFGEAA